MKLKDFLRIGVALFAVMLCTACTGYNNSTSVTENDIYYHLSSDRKEAMVGSYQWDGNEENTVITIPDTLSDGTPVNSIGGFIGIGVPVSFKIEYKVNWPELPNNGKTMSEEEIEAFYKEYADAHPEELTGHLVKLNTSEETDENNDSIRMIYKGFSFTINIGKNISSMGKQMSMSDILDGIYNYGIVQPDGSIIVYRPNLYFNVDPENKTFFSEDGVIYNTADGMPAVTY